MTQDNLVKFKTPETTESFSDALSDLIRSGAQQIIAQAVEAELNELLNAHKDLCDSSGRQAVVRNGYLPARTITTGVGEVEVQVPKVRDRSGSGIKFNSTLLPPYLKRSRSVEEVLPWLYLKGISTGDFAEALSALLGPEAKGLSPATISRLCLGAHSLAPQSDAGSHRKARWKQEHSVWQSRSLKQHIRSSNPIESTFSTVRLRTKKTRGAVSKTTVTPLVFKLVQSAQKRWHRIRGFKLLGDVIEGVQFKDGVRQEGAIAQPENENQKVA